MLHFLKNSTRKCALTALCILSLSVCPATPGISLNTKMGAPTAEELSLKTYPADSTATALYLSKEGYAKYYYNETSGFYIEYTYESRIKILKQDGTEYANVEVPYFYLQGHSDDSEDVSVISATAYNTENGKTTKTKLTKDLIVRESVGPSTMLLKFTIPGAKVGSVIEYKYKITSHRLSSLRSWYAQSGIPVLHTEYDIAIPEYFIFNLETRGYDKIDVQRKDAGTVFNVRQGMASVPVSARTTEIHITSGELEAVKADKYTWCASDYRAHVEFELSGVCIPGSTYKTFTQTWAEIDKKLLDDDDFGGKLRMANPFKDEMTSLALEKLSKTDDKVAAMFSFLLKKMKWNEKYRLWASDIKKDIATGSGSNASFNFVLMSMMRDAGIEAYPVVLSLRSEGVLPYTHPTFDGLSTFVVAFKSDGGIVKYIDASSVNAYINSLPDELLVNRAHNVIKDNPAAENAWTDFSNIEKNRSITQILCSLDASGKIKGNISAYLQGRSAATVRKMRSAQDSTKFVSGLGTGTNIKITKLETSGLNDFCSVARLKMDFEKDASVNGDLIYVNPMVLIDQENNPFTKVTRKLPIEMPHPEDSKITVYMQIPDGYMIEEMPKPLSVSLEGNGGRCIYTISSSDNTVTLQYNFILSQILFPAEAYPQVKQFWNLVVDKNNEMLVLKKKAAVQ